MNRSDNSKDGGRDLRHEWHVGQRLLAVIVAVLVAWALKATAPVTLPLAFALFLVAVFWPLQRQLAGHMHSGWAALLTLLLFLVVVGLFVGALWLSVDMVNERAASYADQFQRILDQVRSWAERQGLPLPGGEQGGSPAPSRDTLVRLSERVFSFAGAFVLVVALFVLSLLEVHDFRDKLSRRLGSEKFVRWHDSAHRIAHDFQRYIVVRTGIGLLNGVLVGLFCWVVGLDFAFIWGLQTFLLNYIPTLGSIAATLPPVLFALVQFDGFGKALLVLAGVGGLQLVLGNYVDPLVQGKYLSLSPLVVLLSVTFWGWLWGIAGAFISIPLTVVIVIASRQFERTRWIAVLLADLEEDETEEEA